MELTAAIRALDTLTQACQGEIVTTPSMLEKRVESWDGALEKGLAGKRPPRSRC